jgi:hypothetical protein
VALYDEVIAEHEREGPGDPEEESRAAAAYLQAWAGWTSPLRDLSKSLEGELRTVRRERDYLERTLRAMSGTITWRLRETLMKIPGLWSASQMFRRLGRGADQRR